MSSDKKETSVPPADDVPTKEASSPLEKVRSNNASLLSSGGWACVCGTPGGSSFLPAGMLGKAVVSALGVLRVGSSAGGCYH
eukprot:CAMPEP_0194334920 /NCGR_PEP_ID=MMETSP0171-20130528/67743_1 /TAXON_ID=218684 /ORGANISM="Corethron pennatum, Strain L29A3" /LENGTH=81 /DNA_ID=CAMNT_0039097775 /DNA_START=11 /DNA_END=253 /DNA_ORIENTATION=-